MPRKAAAKVAPEKKPPAKKYTPDPDKTARKPRLSKAEKEEAARLALEKEREEIVRQILEPPAQISATENTVTDTLPVVVEKRKIDWRKWVTPSNIKFGLIGVFIIIALVFYLTQCRNKKIISKEEKKIEVEHNIQERLQRENDSLAAVNAVKDEMLKQLTDKADEATEDRKRHDIDSEKKTTIIKKNTDETIKKFKNPGLTNDDRLRIIREQLNRSTEGGGDNGVPR